jgi:hypothetical protein
MRYRKALHLFLQQGPASSLTASASLGQTAADLGLETLDMALFHEKVLIPIVSPITSSTNRNVLIERATCFFMEVMIPVEKTHRGAVKTEHRIARLTKMLEQRTKDVHAANRRLTKSRARRQAAEEALQKYKTSSDEEINQTDRRQAQLQKQARELLSAHEAERQNTCLALQNETAQTLCSILIQLLSLKTSARDGELNLKKDIDCTRHIMEESIQRVSKL